MIFLLVTLLGDDQIIYNGSKITITTFNPVITIDQSLYNSGLYIPITITYQDGNKEEKYFFNNNTCGDCLRYFIIEGYVDSIEPDSNKQVHYTDVDQVEIDIYVQLQTIDHTDQAWEYYTSTLYKSCVISSTRDGQNGQNMTLEFTDQYYLQPAKLYNQSLFTTFLYILPQTCIIRVRQQIPNMIFDNSHSYYFASVGINTLLNENQSDNNVSAYGKMSGTGQIIQDPKYVRNTPFVVKNVQNISFNVNESTMFGRNKLYQEKLFNIQKVALDDTGYYHKFMNYCVNFYAVNKTEFQPMIENETQLLEFYPMAEQSSSDEEYKSSGYLCGQEIRLRPLDYFDFSNTTELKYLCNLNNKLGMNEQFLLASCSEYVFTEGYLIFLCGLLSVMCSIWALCSIIHNLYVIFIPWQHSYSTYIIGIVILVIGAFNAILIFTLKTILIAGVPGVSLLLYAMTSYLVTTDVHKTLTREELKVLNAKKLTFTFVISVLVSFIITIFISFGNILMVMVDVYQMLQFFKLETDYLDNFWLIKMVTVICDTYTKLFNASYFTIIPFLVFYYGMQFLTRLEKHIDKLPKKKESDTHFVFDWKNFMYSTILQLITIIQNYIGQMMATFLGEVFNLEVSPTPLQVIFCVISSTYMYSFSKFNMFKPWGICAFRAFRMFAADMAVVLMLFVDIIWTLMCLISSPFLVCIPKYKSVIRYKEQTANTVIWLFKSFWLMLATAISQVFKIIIFLLYPVFLFFAEFMPPFNFLIQAVGIIPHQKELNNIQNDILTESYISVTLRFLIYSSTFLLMSMLMVVQQDLTVWYNCQVFNVVLLLVFYQRALAGNKIKIQRTLDPQRTNIQYLYGQRRVSIILQNLIVICYKYNNFSKVSIEFQNINSNYESYHEYIENYLIEQIINCYNFIPGIGPLLSVFASYLNSPSLSTCGESQYSVQYFLSIIQFGSAIGTLIMYSDNHKMYLIPMIIYFACQCLDSYDEICELTNAHGLDMHYALRCLCIDKIAIKNPHMKAFAKRNIMLSSDDVNAALNNKDADFSKLQRLQQERIQQTSIEVKIQNAQQMGDENELLKLQQKLQKLDPSRVQDEVNAKLLKQQQDAEKSNDSASQYYVDNGPDFQEVELKGEIFNFQYDLQKRSHARRSDANKEQSVSNFRSGIMQSSGIPNESYTSEEGSIGNRWQMIGNNLFSKGFRGHQQPPRGSVTRFSSQQASSQNGNVFNDWDVGTPKSDTENVNDV